MKIKVDRRICSGHARCAVQAPQLYLLDEDGYCIADGKLIPDELIAPAERGASSCPEAAIALVENDE